MANFSLREPKYGDIIRVKIKDDIYHYGIYENDNSVIQFGSAKDAFKTDSSDVCVETTTIKDFLNGKFLEVREYSFIEKIKKNKPDLVIKKAKERLGEKGYNLISNNCLHFVNECVFNKHVN